MSIHIESATSQTSVMSVAGDSTTQKKICTHMRKCTNFVPNYELEAFGRQSDYYLEILRTNYNKNQVKSTKATLQRVVWLECHRVSPVVLMLGKCQLGIYSMSKIAGNLADLNLTSDISE